MARMSAMMNGQNFNKRPSPGMAAGRNGNCCLATVTGQGIRQGHPIRTKSRACWLEPTTAITKLAPFARGNHFAHYQSCFACSGAFWCGHSLKGNDYAQSSAVEGSRLRA